MYFGAVSSQVILDTFILLKSLLEITYIDSLITDTSFQPFPSTDGSDRTVSKVIRAYVREDGRNFKSLYACHPDTHSPP